MQVRDRHKSVIRKAIFIIIVTNITDKRFGQESKAKVVRPLLFNPISDVSH